MHVTACLLLLLLLGTRPAVSVRYISLETALGSEFIRLLLDTNLTVLTPSSLVQSRDFSEILVWDDDTIFVGAANYILKVDSNFVIERTFSVNYTTICTSPTNRYLPSCDNYFRVFLNISNNLYTCYTNRVSNPVCQTLNPDTLATESSPPEFAQMPGNLDGYISPSLPARLFQRNFAIYVSTSNRLVTGSVYDFRANNRITVIDPFISVSPYITTTFYDSENDPMIRNFLNTASFARTAHDFVDTDSNTYVYFMFYEPSDKLLSGTAISRVARFCLDGPSDATNTDFLPQMQTFIKGELKCGNVFPSLVQDWVFADVGGVIYYYAVFSSLEKGPKTSYLCKYNLTSISTTMDSEKQCMASTVLESDPINPTADSPILAHSGALFTQLQRYSFPYDGTTYEMIYISLTDGSIMKYCISCAQQLIEVIQVVPSEVMASYPDLSALDRLQLNKDGGYLVAGGYTGLYKVPLETCELLGEDYTTCMADPMCYYDTAVNLCMAVDQTTPSPSNSILHLESGLPVVTCSSLSGHITVNRIDNTTSINATWSCPMANVVDIVAIYSNGSTEDIQAVSAASGVIMDVVLTYFDLDTIFIDTIYVKPFLTHNTISRALPGTILYTNATYDVMQLAPPSTAQCTPVPPQCGDPECVGTPSCDTGCAAVTIDCSKDVQIECTATIAYTINDQTPQDAPTNGIIQITRALCPEGCLFQAYAYNGGVETAGTSHWLSLLRPIDQYTPVISAERTAGSEFSFSAFFTQFTEHTCESPAITTNPASSPYTLMSCREFITAEWSSTTDTSLQGSVEVFSSQAVMAPTNVQLDLSVKTAADECWYISDVIVRWDPPAYAIPDLAQARYIIYGDICSGTVTGATTYTCPDVTLGYNIQYTVQVTSLEPCFNKAGAVTSMSAASEMSSVPAQPRGLGYAFDDDNLTLSWAPPLCEPLNGAISYEVFIMKTCADCSPQDITMVTMTTSNTMLQTSLNESNDYDYYVRLRTVTNSMFSEAMSLNFSTNMSSDAVDCRPTRVIINPTTNVVTCETLPSCDDLGIASTTVTVTYDSMMVDDEEFPTGCPGLEYYFSPDSGEGLYTISVYHTLEISCSTVPCTTEVANAFYNHNPVTTSVPPTQIGQICQDEKAYIILALAVIAIACAIGNFGFMVVAFCVFCIPRRKIFRCC